METVVESMVGYLVIFPVFLEIIILMVLLVTRNGHSGKAFVVSYSETIHVNYVQKFKGLMRNHTYKLCAEIQRVDEKVFETVRT